MTANEGRPAVKPFHEPFLWTRASAAGCRYLRRGLKVPQPLKRLAGAALADLKEIGRREAHK